MSTITLEMMRFLWNSIFSHFFIYKILNRDNQYYIGIKNIFHSNNNKHIQKGLLN